MRTAANGCERLRTVADGCGRLRTVANLEATGREQSSTPRPPRVKGQPFATHSGKKGARLARLVGAHALKHWRAVWLLPAPWLLRVRPRQAHLHRACGREQRPARSLSGLILRPSRLRGQVLGLKLEEREANKPKTSENQVHITFEGVILHS